MPSCNARYLCPISTKNGAAQQFAVKLSNNKNHGNPLSSSPAVTNGRSHFNGPSAGMPTCLAAAPLDTCVVLKRALLCVIFLQMRSHIYIFLNLRFVSPCIFIPSNELIPTRYSIYLQVYCLSFNYSSTCFGHPLAHHQESSNCSSSPWFTVGTWW